ncbi:transglutaminase-like cysteine peptidase [Methylobacterium sp. B4]|uniref:transglutaminase-like cysteine peptidase n=1 Tax=Methylobacterium sp. B4 TaxID=1938755 RepID=UPI001FDF6157|nr:transglutaminase-like cysteine peptidase [Methylobacterium sp. B4]
MRTFKDALEIRAWRVFCDGPGKVECAVDTAQPDHIELTARNWKEIEDVNTRVNRTVKLVADQEHWGAPDVWGLAEDGKGDSEDYVLLKRKLLVGKGLSRRAMRFTVVIDAEGHGHGLLTVITDRGDFVLDNKTDTVWPWHQTGYVFIKREGQDKVGWVSLGGVTDPSSYDKMSKPKEAGGPAPKPLR